jgi:hypothetical protein
MIAFPGYLCEGMRDKDQDPSWVNAGGFTAKRNTLK